MLLLPYTKCGECWSLPDMAILKFASDARESGLLNTVFHDGKMQEPKEFLAAMKRPENLPVFIADCGKMIGFAWLNGISEFHAFPHFGFIEGAPYYEAGSEVLSYWSKFSTIKTLIGVLAASNKTAIVYAMRLGFKSAGTVPSMLDVHGVPTDGCVMYRSNSVEADAGDSCK